MIDDSTCDELRDISFTNAEELEEQREQEEEEEEEVVVVEEQHNKEVEVLDEEKEEEETLSLPWDTEEHLRERMFYQFYQLFAPNVHCPTFVARLKNMNANGFNSAALAEWFEAYSKHCQPIIHDLEVTYKRFQNLHRKEETEKEARIKEARIKQRRTELAAAEAREVELDDQIDKIEKQLRLMRTDKQQAARNANRLRRVLREEEEETPVCTPLTASSFRITRMDATQIDSDLLKFIEPSLKKQKH